MSDYSKDLAICEKATDGPWELLFEERQDKSSILRRVQDNNNKRAIILSSATDCDDDYKYIAHFSPSHMIECIKREQAKDARIVELEAFVRTVFESSLMESDDVIKATFHGYIQYAEELLK